MSAIIIGSDMASMGNPAIRQSPLLALFCSSRCPASLIVRAQDLAAALGQTGAAVIGGFHSPVEKEMLTVLLRGEVPLVICPARGLEGIRIPAAWRGPLQAGRLLLLSPFPGSLRRPRAEHTARRNRLVADLAERVLVIHAAPGGKLEAECQAWLAAGKAVFTLEGEHNRGLVEMGARVWVGER